MGEKSNVTQGVPRLQEILYNTQKMKNPEVTVFLDEEYRYDYFTDDKFDDNFIIDDSNHLSLKECLREYIFVTSPMKPVCNKICKL